jgi:outer membrane receptor for ferrienterochelin and colicin
MNLKKSFFIKNKIIWIIHIIIFYSLIGITVQTIFIHSLHAAQFPEDKDLQNVKVTMSDAEVSLEQAFQIIEQQTGFKFFYIIEDVPLKEKVKTHQNEKSLYDILQDIARETGLIFNRINNQIVVKKGATNQQTATVHGFIRNKSNGESLPFVTVMIKGLKVGTTTNTEGFYVLSKLPEGIFVVHVSLIGYKTEQFEINTKESKTITHTVLLENESLEEKEVVVTGDRLELQNKTQTGYIMVKGAELNTIPSIGEADLFRALQVMPGIKAVSEMSSGLYIRGGSADQNLILLDGTVVYNPSHLFGFFSTFNSDAIKNVELSKGGYPAEYGGRLSSVLNVTNIDGDRIKFHGKGSISLISSRLTAEGPLGNGSCFFSGRRTYFDQMVKLARRDTGANALPLYYFYDANGKINQDIGENDKISVVGYIGKDNLHYNVDRGTMNLDMDWGNATVSSKWTHIFSPTVFSNFFATYSNYIASTTVMLGSTKYTQDNSIKDLSLKGDINFYPTNDHLVKLGFWWSQYKIAYRERFGDELNNFLTRPKQLAIYVQDEWKTSSLLAVQSGIRAEYQTLTRSTTIGPRLSARYFLSENISLKAATGMYYQYLNAVPIDVVSGFSPFDIWIPMNDKMKPSRSIDFVLGLETEPIEHHSLSVEGYYKTYKNVLYWIGEPTQVTNVNELFYIGKGRAFGTELLFQRRIGALTGSIGYTLAWTYRTFPELNKGNEFMPKFDRRHSLSIVGNYDIDEKWQISAVFTYSTGQSFTDGIARYSIHTDLGIIDNIMPGSLYNYRLPPYHRLDVSITKKMTLFGLQGSWFVQIYNIYNHKNVWYRQFDIQKNPTKVTDLTLLPIIPTLGLNIEF